MKIKKEGQEKFDKIAKKYTSKLEGYESDKSQPVPTPELCFHCDRPILEWAILPALCQQCAYAFMQSNSAKKLKREII